MKERMMWILARIFGKKYEGHDYTPAGHYMVEMKFFRGHYYVIKTTKVSDWP